jgi:hypothetical protein
MPTLACPSRSETTFGWTPLQEHQGGMRMAEVMKSHVGEAGRCPSVSRSASGAAATVRRRSSSSPRDS